MVAQQAVVKRAVRAQQAVLHFMQHRAVVRVVRAQTVTVQQAAFLVHGQQAVVVRAQLRQAVQVPQEPTAQLSLAELAVVVAVQQVQAMQSVVTVVQVATPAQAVVVAVQQRISLQAEVAKVVTVRFEYSVGKNFILCSKTNGSP